ncbi:MAG TPA: hemerythrin domain-containing protein [Planctomycetota bacterium]|nr:hemerythrin domain-containing protein [Planctomycetota bacterium]
MNNSGHRSADSVDDALRADHECLDALLLKLEAAVSAESAGAAEDLNRFSRVLSHHMAWEDDRLFPAVMGVVGAKERRSIESLEIDHERLRDTIQSLESTLAATDYGTARTLVRWLGTLLKGHNYDEEHGVYVEADRLLGAADRRRLIEQFVAGRPKEPP